MRDSVRLIKQIAVLRWVIPITTLLFGIAYMLFDDLVLEGRSIASPFVVLDALLFGAIGAGFAWFTLTWARRAAVIEVKAQKDTQRRALQLESASRAIQQITAILDMDELLEHVVKLVREIFGYHHVSLFLVDAHSNELVLRMMSGDTFAKLRGLRLKIGEHGITSLVARTGRPILCNDVSQEPRYRPHELIPDTRSELAVPLWLAHSVVGVFDVQSHHLGAFRSEDIGVLQILADQVAIALENARLFQETRQQFQAMRVLHDISLDITAKLDSQQVLTAILKQATELLKAEASNLSLYNPSTGLVRMVAVHNLPPDFTKIDVPLSEGVIGQVVMTGKPIIVNQYGQWEKRSPRFGALVHDAIVAAPLRWQGEVFGVLGVGDRSERRAFDDKDVTLLALFADLASIALKNSELYEQVVGLSRDLEHKVEERTEELSLAREELARKAAQLQRLLTITVHVQEEERGRIARDLHDGSNQLITAATYELQAARESLLGQRGQATLQKLETVKDLLRKIDAENRRIILGLRPPVLDVQGLLPALNWYANNFQRQCGICCTVQISGESIRLSPEIEIAAYRIVQESLNNISAHARAQHVQIEIHFDHAEFQISVIDDGIGFDQVRTQTEPSGRMGLIGMSERAQSIGGQLQVESILGSGTRITVRAPIAAMARKDRALELGVLAGDPATRIP